METVEQIQANYKRIREAMQGKPNIVNRALEFRKQVEQNKKKVEAKKPVLPPPANPFQIRAAFPDLSSLNLKPAFNPEQIKFHDIVKWVCLRSGYTKMELFSQRRTNDLCYNRQLVWQIAKKVTPMSLPQMGKLSGGRDHTTVLHAIRKTPHNIDEIIAEMMRDLSGGSINVNVETAKTVIQVYTDCDGV